MKLAHRIFWLGQRRAWPVLLGLLSASFYVQSRPVLPVDSAAIHTLEAQPPALSSDSALVQAKVAKDPERHSPTKAAWRAAVLPGWGQIYNQKYWKLPLVYGGLGGLGYWVYFNADQHRFYRQAFLAKTDEDPSTIDPLPAFSESSVLQTKEYYRRQLDASVLFTVAFYGLQIVDAVVDAHLFHFDVSNDLSLRWNPWTAPASGAFSAQAAQFSKANRLAFPAQGLQLILTYR